MARIIPFCSSSKGNSVFIGTKNNGILVDMGCSFKRLNTGLSSFDMDLSAIKAVVVTHEHSDHVQGLAQLTKRTSIPIFASADTLLALINNNLVSSTANLHTTDELELIDCDIDVKCFHTPHDSAESVGYTFVVDGIKIGFCTDLGCVTDEVRNNIVGSNFVFLEANYEPAWLNSNPRYPVYLKKRIASNSGHLSNPDSASFVTELVRNGSTQIVLGHLSQENNTPEQVRKYFKSILSAAGIKIGFDVLLDVAPVLNEQKLCYAM